MKEKTKKRKIAPFIIIVGIIILPLLYSLLYLGAFWDPYANLDTVPVAVVNEDKGATIQDEPRNLGDEMCDTLKEDGTLKFVFTDAQTARKGTKEKEFYATITIPENFSESVASASTTDKQVAKITYTANEKRNYLASQILNTAVSKIEASMKASIDKEIVSQLSDKLRSAPDQLGTLTDGTAKLVDGSKKLNDGTKTFNSKLGEYQTGVQTATDGSKKLATNLQTLDTGINSLLAGATKLDASTQNLKDLKTGAAQLSAGASEFNNGLIAYTAGVDTLIGSVKQTTTVLAGYAQKTGDKTISAVVAGLTSKENQASIGQLSAASTQLKTASAQITAATKQLSDGTANITQLNDAIGQLKDGLAKAKTGSAALATGATTLNNGMIKLDDATGKLVDASATINEGTGKLYDGITELDNGANDSITDAKEELKALDGLDAYAKEPVELVSDPYAPVPNYGTSFAPYFMSLSLWVGGIMIFFGIYYEPDKKFKLLSRESDNKILRSFAYLFIGFLQAAILDVVLIFGLGLHVNRPTMFFVSSVLVSMVFIAIIQLLIVGLKDLGKFLSLVFLILQLTSCGGTFPMETVPKLFNKLFPFMPMTYSVGMFKEAISGIGTKTYAIHEASILLAILVVTMTLTILISRAKKIRNELVEA